MIIAGVYRREPCHCLNICMKYNPQHVTEARAAGKSVQGLSKVTVNNGVLEDDSVENVVCFWTA